MKRTSLMMLIFCLSAPVWAGDKGEHFDEAKQQRLKMMDEQITSLQSARSCVASASNHDAMKACHEAVEKAHKERRMEHLNERIQRLEKEKAGIK